MCPTEQDGGVEDGNLDVPEVPAVRLSRGRLWLAGLCLAPRIQSTQGPRIHEYLLPQQQQDEERPERRMKYVDVSMIDVQQTDSLHFWIFVFYRWVCIS
jgi:hypothetical protein